YNVNAAVTWAVDATSANTASKVVARDASGNFSAGTITATLSGNASTATTASNLAYFRCTGSVNVGGDATDANAVGYVAGISLLGQSDGGLIKQVYSSAWMGEIYIDYRTGQLCSRGKNNGTLQAWRTQVDSGNYTSYAVSRSVDTSITSKIIVGGSSRDGGMYGTYDSTKTQSIWSMGIAYKCATDGSNFGGLYGLAYKHTNNATGGTMAGGHQMVWCQSGTPCCALGNGIWTSGSITGALGAFSGRISAGGLTLGYSNTSYVLSTSSFICNSWIRTTGSTGWFNETYSGGVYMTDSTWVRVYNSKKFYVPSTAIDSIRTDGAFVREGYAGTSWNTGQGALGVAIVNNSAQTPLLVAYRSGQAANVTGINRLFAVELLNTGTTLQLAFAGSAKFTLTSGGNFTATGEMTAYSASDKRLKKNIRPLDGLSILRKLKFKEFDWNDNARRLSGDNRQHGVGLIAQETKNVLPDLVGNIYN
ncbi:MAG: tail fiber domain-containing protein, partial [Butyricimonas faecihominis]